MNLNKRPHSIREVSERVILNKEMFPFILSEFLDYFYLLTDKEKKQDSINNQPKIINESSLNAYLAACAEHLARKNDLLIPDWTEKNNYFLKEPFFDNAGIKNLNLLLLAESPIAFRKRLIFTEKNPLRRLPKTI